MRPLFEIATDIHNAWAKVNYAARPYLDAMSTLESVNDSYGYDSGTSIVAYFLSNAGGFRGAEAKALKAELKAML